MTEFVWDSLISPNSTLYVSDLDGTLLDDSQSIPSESVTIINQFIAQGYLFSIATARSFESAYPKIKNLNLQIPIICHNGIFIVDPIQKSTIKSTFLEEGFVKSLLEIYSQLHLNPILYALTSKGQNKVYYTGIHNLSEQNYIEDRLANQDPRFTLVTELPISNHKIIEINIVLPDSQVEEIFSHIPPNPEIYIHQMKDIYTPGYTLIEVTPREGNKKDALIFLKNRLQVSKIVCFGDNKNDIPMFEVSDEGYAVENAVDALKELATRIIQKNTNNGVARYLQEIMNKEQGRLDKE